MSVNYNARYNSVSEITGPSGWYWINTYLGPVQTYVNQSYSGGGWVLALANRASTNGMTNLTYNDAINTCNIRTGAGSTVVPAGSKLSTLDNYNYWLGLKYWSLLTGRVTSSKVTVVQFVSGTNGTALDNTGAHNKRYRWQFNSFNSNWGDWSMAGAAVVSDETSTGTPGLYTYHAANAYSLTTYDQDHDAYPGNCSTNYNNNPWWYGGCWDGNYFAGGGYGDKPYWSGSGSDFWQYGAVYIK